MSNNMPSFAAVKRYVDANVPLGLSKDQILVKFLKENSDLDEKSKKTMASYVNQAIKENYSYKEIQEYLSGIFLAGHDQKDGYVLLNPHTHTKRPIKKSILKDVVSPKLDLRSKILPCYFTYNPFSNQEIYEENGQTNFNSYEAPFWFRAYFYEGVPIPIAKEMPEIHKRFFNHLFEGDEKSINYVIKWIANSFRDRNRCYLATLANQGVGKGTLGKIMGALHGESNYAEIEWGRNKDKRFNGVYGNKRIIYIDEIDVKTRAQEDMIKNFTNDTMEIELKGVDSKTVINYASLYLSSNHLDALRLSADDRRFSIVEMTSIKLPTVFNKEELDQILDDKNIEQLAQFLMGVELDPHEMLKPFVSNRTALVREASVTDMEDYIINEYCKTHAGQDILVEELQNHLSEKFGAKYKPTVSYLSTLGQKMPGHYKIHRPTVESGARPRKIKIEELKNQPPTNYELTK